MPDGQIPAPVASLAEALRKEIAASLSAQIDFLKWKLILVSFLGGAAFGFLQAEVRFPYVLLLVPWVCLYCDLCYWHLHLRVVRNGYFFRTSPYFAETAWQRYEDYSAQVHTTNVYFFEAFAVVAFTVICCLLVGLLSVQGVQRLLRITAFAGKYRFLFGISGGAGIAALLITRLVHDRLKERLFSINPSKASSITLEE